MYRCLTAVVALVLFLVFPARASATQSTILYNVANIACLISKHMIVATRKIFVRPDKMRSISQDAKSAEL